MPSSLRLPGLETLSLAHVRALRGNVRNLLHERCTPALQQLALTDLSSTENVGNFMYYFPFQHIDLRRLNAVQLEPHYGYELPESFVYPEGPFKKETAVLLVWSVTSDTFYVDEEKASPQYLQLDIPSTVFEPPEWYRRDQDPWFVKKMYRIRDAIYSADLSAVFVPSSVRLRRSVKPWIEAAIKTLFDVCIECRVPVHFYSNWEATGMSKVFLRCLADPGMEDENPLISENRRWSSIADIPKDDDGTLWTLAEGLPDKEEESEYM